MFRKFSSDSLSFVTLVLLLLISFSFCYFFVKKLSNGIPRLISLLGVFYILFLAPWYFPFSILLRGLASFFISWMTSFKLLLFAFGKGDLILCNDYLSFVVVATFPFKIKNKSNMSPVETKSQKGQMDATSPCTGNLCSDTLQMLALAISLSFLASYFRGTISFYLILFVAVHFGMVIMMPQLEAIHILKQPYKATSLQDFWGRRWNRVASDILRHTIYDPTQKLLQSFIGVGRGKMVALVVTLVVSGVMHEIMFFHMTCGMKPTWEVSKFFILQGGCMAIEIAIKRSWVRGLGWPALHPVVSIPLTLGFVLTTSYWLVVLPVWRISGRECDRKGLGVQLMERLLHV